MNFSLNPKKQRLNFLAGLILTCLSFPLTAQVVITDAHSPVAGNQVTWYPMDVSGVSAGPSGSSVTWNFSLQPDSNKSHFVSEWKSVSASPFATFYPDADLAWKDSSGYWYHYSSGDTLLFRGDGLEGSPNPKIYTDPALQMIFPDTFGQVVNDTFSYFVEGLTDTVGGTIILHYDAFGILHLPWTSLGNVSRVKRSEIFVNPGAALDTLYRNTWLWFYASEKFPVLRITEDSIPGMVISKRVEASSVVVSTPEYVSDDLTVFPNPVVDQLTIHYPGPFSWNLFDVSGRRIADGNSSGSAEQLDLSGIPSGNYILNILSESRVFSRVVLKR